MSEEAYSVVLSHLEALMVELENPDLPLEHMESKVEEALVCLNRCQEILRGVDERLQVRLQSIQS
jgi:exodeoxyribonuclease VII small subunit